MSDPLSRLQALPLYSWGAKGTALTMQPGKGALCKHRRSPKARVGRGSGEAAQSGLYMLRPGEGQSYTGKRRRVMRLERRQRGRQVQRPRGDSELGWFREQLDVQSGCGKVGGSGRRPRGCWGTAKQRAQGCRPCRGVHTVATGVVLQLVRVLRVSTFKPPSSGTRAKGWSHLEAPGSWEPQ